MCRLFLLVLFFVSPLAFATADDICFDDDGNMFNCVELKDACYPLNEGKACRAQMAQHIVHALITTHEPRSMVHMDATFYIAQAVGLDYETAHRIAAYDQAIDLGDYVPVDMKGNPLVNPSECEGNNPPDMCKYYAKPLNGLIRTSVSTGGSFFHYTLPFNPTNKELNGHYPFFNGPSIETMLTNLRSWIWSNDVLCTAGLIDQTTKKCYLKPNDIKTKLYGTIPTLEKNKRFDVDFNMWVEEQILHEDAKQKIVSTNLHEYVDPAHVNHVKMGIYLHVLQDRISHHSCIDKSTVIEPSDDSNQNWGAYFDRETCHQGIHLVWHGWETGMDQSMIAPQHQNLWPTLDNTYDVLLAFAELKNLAKPDAKKRDYKMAVLENIFEALQIGHTRQRMDTLIKNMNKFGFEPLPAHGVSKDV